MKIAYLIRTYYDSHTAGILTLTDGNRVLFTCNTMELPNKNNERRVSCIPEGTYKVVPYSSAKYKSAYHIENVPDRDAILIHPANTVADLLGCIGVGLFAKLGTISESRATLAKLKKVADVFKLVIIDGTHTDRGLESVLPLIVSLLSNLSAPIVEMIAQKEKSNHGEIIRAILKTDATAENKVLLIETILNL